MFRTPQGDRNEEGSVGDLSIKMAMASMTGLSNGESECSSGRIGSSMQTAMVFATIANPVLDFGVEPPLPEKEWENKQVRKDREESDEPCSHNCDNRVSADICVDE